MTPTSLKTLIPASRRRLDRMARVAATSLEVLDEIPELSSGLKLPNEPSSIARLYQHRREHEAQFAASRATSNSGGSGMALRWVAAAMIEANRASDD